MLALAWVLITQTSGGCRHLGTRATSGAPPAVKYDGPSVGGPRAWLGGCTTTAAPMALRSAYPADIQTPNLLYPAVPLPPRGCVSQAPEYRSETQAGAWRGWTGPEKLSPPWAPSWQQRRSVICFIRRQKTPTQPASYASTDSSHYKYIKRLTIDSVPGNKVELDWSRRNPFNASSLSISNFPAATLQSGRGGRPVEVSTKFCGTFHNIILRRHPPPARQQLLLIESTYKNL